MSASCLKPSLNSIHGASKLSKHKKVFLQKKNQKLIQPWFVSILFLLCIIILPEKPSHVASICEKYNSSLACQVW
tara:strand:- start:405 stop:629 length:225 start_codon:yes stop_codon:yes gene_type:complete